MAADIDLAVTAARRAFDGGPLTAGAGRARRHRRAKKCCRSSQA
nr:hypothetical protein [Paracoccus sp. IB05]